MAGGVLMEGLLYGKLPIVGKKDWLLYYIEIHDRHFHIYEGNESPSKSRKHLQSLELHHSDRTGFDGKDKKSDYKFFYDRGSGGRYVFRCQKSEQRQEWIMTLQKLIQKREYIEKGILVEDSSSFTASLPASPSLTKVDTPTPPPRTTTLPSNHRIMSTVLETPPPPPPHNRPSPFLQKRDSGFVSGTGVVSQAGGYRCGGSADGEIFHVKSNSGDSAVVHSTAVRLTEKSSSADGSFMRKQNTRTLEEEEEDLGRYEWYWGPMSREECGRGLKERGQIGNFVVRKNDRGDFVMSFWRKDGVHHHRILKHNNVYRFEKSAVDAQGEGIPDLLDTYMKHCTDKTIGPYGGQLYPTYDQAWNPPEIDFNQFQEVLNKKAEETGAKRIFKPGLEMADNTYGGMSLHQIKDAIDKNQMPPPPSPRNKEKLNPFGGYKPQGSPSPGGATAAAVRSKPLPATKPKPQKSPVHSRPQSGGYVNFVSKQSPQVAPRYENTKVPSYDSEDEEEEEDQEMYIAPGDIDTNEDEDEQPIYENHGPTSTSSKSNGAYANVPMHGGGGGGGDGVYQNVSFDGKPYTPPRQIKPSPQVKHRLK